MFKQYQVWIVSGSALHIVHSLRPTRRLQRLIEADTLPSTPNMPIKTTDFSPPITNASTSTLVKAKANKSLSVSKPMMEVKLPWLFSLQLVVLHKSSKHYLD